MIGLTRREFVALVASSLFTPRAAGDATPSPIITRPIPHSGERLPAVGLGTASVFDRDTEETRRSAAAVVHTLLDGGARLIDTASTYADAELVLGKVLAAEGVRDRIFIATKLEEPDEAELERSLTRLRTRKLDLLQLHNVRDTRQSLAQFFAWKRQGICRYVGITSSGQGGNGGGPTMWCFTTSSLTKPFAHQTVVDNAINLTPGGFGWYFSYTHSPANVPATPKVLGPSFDFWMDASEGTTIRNITKRVTCKLTGYTYWP